MSEHRHSSDGKDDLQTVHTTHEQHDQGIDPAQEAKLRRKLDLYILPVTTLVFFLTFLDRTNIGNARAAGLVQDLRLHQFDFNAGTSIFYLTYLLLDIPGTLAVKRFGFILIPLSVVGFGTVTLFTAFIENRAGFYVTRFFLGVTESISLPGLSYLLNRYYRRHELTSRYGVFMLLAVGGSGGFGGLLAAGLLTVGRIGSRAGWRNIFLVEGIMTVGLGIILCFVFPTDPERTRYLTEAERELAIKRIYADQPQIRETKEKMNRGLIKRGILNVNTLVCVWIFATSNSTVQGLTIFLPSILRVNYPGSSNVRIQLLTVPVYVCATGVGVFICYLCVKFRIHWPFAALGAICSIIGYSIWIATDATYVNARYAACFINLISGLINGPAIIGWAAANASPDTLRAMVGAVVSGFGGIGSIAGVWAYTANTASSGFRPGNAFNLAMGSSALVLSIGLMLYQKWENRMREEGKRDYRLQEVEGGAVIEVLGNRHPSYRYIS